MTSFVNKHSFHIGLVFVIKRLLTLYCIPFQGGTSDVALCIDWLVFTYSVSK